MFRVRPRVYVSARKMTVVVFSVASFWACFPSVALGQVDVEPPPAWSARLLSEFGSPDSPFLKSEREDHEKLSDAVERIHEQFQDKVNDISLEAQFRGLEPSIMSETADGNVALIEVEMRSDLVGGEKPSVYVWGVGRDFADAFLNRNQPPLYTRSIPDVGGVIFEDGYFFLAYDLGGKLHVDAPYPPGWNQGTTRAERDQLALRLAEPYRYYAQCTVAAINAQAKVAAQLSRIAPSPQNSPQRSSGPFTQRPSSEARPHNPQRPEFGNHTDSGSEGNRGGGGGPGASSGRGGSSSKVIEIQPPAIVTPRTPEERQEDGEENLVGRTPSLHLQKQAGDAQSSWPQGPISAPRPDPAATGIQGGKGTIKGFVHDPRGGVLSFIKVTLKSAVHGTSDYVYSDALGGFYFTSLPAGPKEFYALVVDGYPRYSFVEEFPLVKDASVVQELVTLEPRTVNKDVNWGLPATRAWVDLNGDGAVDFCRILPQMTPAQKKTGREDQSRQNTDVLACDLSTGPSLEKLYQGQWTSIPVPTEARNDKFAWVHFHDTQHLDFCRAVPTSSDGRKGRLVCITWEGTGFGKTVSTPKNQPIDLGIPSGRAWVDFDGDGKADFCTLIVSPKLEHQLACWLSKGDKFSDKPIVSYDVKWPDNPKLRAWVDVNADGKIDFCSVQGPNHEFFDCVLSNGREFGSPIRDLIRQPVKP